MNIPVALTLSRLAAIPVLMALLIVRFPGHDQIAAALFILFSLTDTLDGQIARRRGLVSDLGKFLDPLADKLFVLSVLIVLVQEGMVAAWVVVVIFSRELIITILRSVAATKGGVISAAPLGKTKTITQMSAVTLLILQRPYPALVPLAEIAVVVAIVFTLWSGLDYLWRFRYVLGLEGLRQNALEELVGRVRDPNRDDADPPARELGELLRKARLTVSVAESCTGGLLGSLITDLPGSSAYFLGGAIVYSDQAKREQLGVSAPLLARVGAVSAEVGEAMAAGARSRFGTDLAAGVTGIAGPEAGGTDKPVGLTYIAVASARGTSSREFHFTGNRASNRRQAALEAVAMLVDEARKITRKTA